MRPFITILAASMYIISTLAHSGNTNGGGGDENEPKFNEIAVNIAAWINAGNADTLTLPSGLSIQDYRAHMLDRLTHYHISFTTSPILVAGVEKTCRNFVDDTGNQILCNSARFASAYSNDANDVFRTVHHEFACLARVEVNSGQDSDYRVSNQISAYLRQTTVMRLPVVRTDVNAEQLMINAIQNDSPEQIRTALASGWNIRADLHLGQDPRTYRTQLHALGLAARLGKLNAVRALLNQGATNDDTSWRGFNAIDYAADANQVEAIRLLVSLGANINSVIERRDSSYVGPPIVLASGVGAQEAVQALLELGADPNLRGGGYGSSVGTDGATALMAIVNRFSEISQGKRMAIARILLEHGANPGLEDRGSFSPFISVVLQGNLEMVRLFMQNHSNLVNVRIDRAIIGTMTALGAACSSEFTNGNTLAMVQLLVENGANVNLKYGKSTALQDAARGGDADLVNYLIEHGAWVNEVASLSYDHSTQTEVNATALDIAIRHNNTRAAEIIRAAGGKRFSELPR